ncbi:hypothetical protein BDV98DRAFT_582273 [Pterulicium gracile]|uniref:Uncharacterized protein n=1 Tax=Pterulicium gracile TaxID=1884261 RepID=A0A5C3QNL4_9AGAR|nr:hypothetical protein BDV98DRAFT_582273 [Pterula gracilis]
MTPTEILASPQGSAHDVSDVSFPPVLWASSATSTSTVGGGSFDHARITSRDMNSNNTQQEFNNNSITHNYYYPAGADVASEASKRQRMDARDSNTTRSSRSPSPIEPPSSSGEEQRSQDPFDPSKIVFGPLPSPPSKLEAFLFSKANTALRIWVVTTNSAKVIADPELHKALALRQTQSFLEDTLESLPDFGQELKNLIEEYMIVRARCNETLNKNGWRKKKANAVTMKTTLDSGTENHSRLMHHFTLENLSSKLKDDTTLRKVKAWLNRFIQSERSAKSRASHSSWVSGDPGTGLKTQAESDVWPSTGSAVQSEPISHPSDRTSSPSSSTRAQTGMDATNAQEQPPYNVERTTDFVKESSEPRAQVVIAAFGSTELSGIEGLLKALDLDTSSVSIARSDSTEVLYDEEFSRGVDQELSIHTYIVDEDGISEV